jgi:hypothetical protein
MPDPLERISQEALFLPPDQGVGIAEAIPAVRILEELRRIAPRTPVRGE